MVPLQIYETLQKFISNIIWSQKKFAEFIKKNDSLGGPKGTSESIKKIAEWWDWWNFFIYHFSSRIDCMAKCGPELGIILDIDAMKTDA